MTEAVVGMGTETRTVTRASPQSGQTGPPHDGHAVLSGRESRACVVRSVMHWSHRPCSGGTEQQARRVLAALEERMAEVGLQLHPDKTRIVCVPRAQEGEVVM